MDRNEQYLNEVREEIGKYQKSISEIKKSLKENTSQDVQKMYGSFQNILQETSEAYEKLKSASAQEWEPLKKIVSDSLEELKRLWGDLKNTTSEEVQLYSRQAKEYAQEMFGCSEDYIKNNPVRSVLLAGALGFVLGRMLK